MSSPSPMQRCICVCISYMVIFVGSKFKFTMLVKNLKEVSLFTHVSYTYTYLFPSLQVTFFQCSCIFTLSQINGGLLQHTLISSTLMYFIYISQRICIALIRDISYLFYSCRILYYMDVSSLTQFLIVDLLSCFQSFSIMISYHSIFQPSVSW